jgi:predicted metal-dependent HD superfamily phosphohydrolase
MPPAQPDRLLLSWLPLVADLGGPPEAGPALFADLARRYAEPGRYYHTLDHIAAMLDTLAGLGLPAASSPRRAAGGLVP